MSNDDDDHVSRETSAGSGPAFPGKHGREEVLREILRHLGVEATITVETSGEPGVVWWRIAGDASGITIGRYGQTLDALEHILNRVGNEDGAPKIHLDSEGYRQRRAESLEDRARRIADDVRRTGRPHELPPMSPRDRRTVHLALKDDPDVETRSEGQEPNRVLVVYPRTPGR